MVRRRDIRFDRYVLSSLEEGTEYDSLEQVKEVHGRTVLFSNAKLVVVRRKMEGGYVGEVLIYSEAS